jgi:hypothetical protein
VYDAPTVAFGSGEAVVMVSGEAVIPSWRILDAVCGELLESATEIVIADVPETIGVPLIKPLDELPDSPLCNPLYVHAYGGAPPTATGWKL